MKIVGYHTWKNINVFGDPKIEDWRTGKIITSKYSLVLSLFGYSLLIHHSNDCLYDVLFRFEYGVI